MFPKAFLFYEYLVTVEQEIQHVWGRKVGGVAIVFLLVRYIPMIHQVLTLALLYPSQTYTV